MCGVVANGLWSVSYKIPSVITTLQGIFKQVCQYIPFLLISSILNCAFGFVSTHSIKISKQHKERIHIMQTKIRIPSVHSPRFILWIGFILSYSSEILIGIGIIPDNNIVKLLQYVIILAPIGLNLLIMFMNKKPTMFYDELISGIILIAILGTLSLYYSYKAGRFAFESIMQLIQIILPFLYAYLMINLFNLEEIKEFMIIAIFLTCVGYISNVGISKFFVLSNYTSISYTTSYSAFENSAFAEVASGLAAYFIYNIKKMPLLATLALILNLFIFKRVFILMVIVLLILTLMNKENDLVNKKLVKFAKLFWCTVVFMFYFIYQPAVAQLINRKLGIDLVGFTMARIYRLWYVIEQGFQSYGLGSTSLFIRSSGVSYIGAEFEMDFIRVLFEIGPIAIIAIVFTYLKIVRYNKYSFFLICLCFLNLLMANGLVMYWGWSMRLITIAIINNYGNSMSRVEPVPYSETQSHIFRRKKRDVCNRN